MGDDGTLVLRQAACDADASRSAPVPLVRRSVFSWLRRCGLLEPVVDLAPLCFGNPGQGWWPYGCFCGDGWDTRRPVPSVPSPCAASHPVVSVRRAGLRAGGDQPVGGQATCSLQPAAAPML